MDSSMTVLLCNLEARTICSSNKQSAKAGVALQMAILLKLFTKHPAFFYPWCARHAGEQTSQQVTVVQQQLKQLENAIMSFVIRWRGSRNAVQGFKESVEHFLALIVSSVGAPSKGQPAR